MDSRNPTAGSFKKKKSLWLIIIVYVTVIYLTLPIMRPVLNFLYKTLGKDVLSLGVNGLLILAILSFLIFIFKNSNQGYGRQALILVILLVGGVVAMGYERPEERLHFLEYGILGYLVLKATMNSWRLSVLSSFVLVSIIGIGDETIQRFLPNRVGDIRDVFMNSFGGLLGIGVMGVWNGKR